MATKVTKRLSLPTDTSDKQRSPRSSVAGTTKRMLKLRRKKVSLSMLEDSALDELLVVLAEDKEQMVVRSLLELLQAYEVPVAAAAIARLLAKEACAWPLLQWAFERAAAAEEGLGSFWWDEATASVGGGDHLWWLLLREYLLTAGGELVYEWLQEHASEPICGKKDALLVVDPCPAPWFHDMSGVACPKQAYDHEVREQLLPLVLELLAMLSARIPELPANALKALAQCAFSQYVAGDDDDKHASSSRSKRRSKRENLRSKTFILRAVVVAFVMPAICRMTPLETEAIVGRDRLLQFAQLFRDVVLGDTHAIEAEGILTLTNIKKVKQARAAFKDAVGGPLFARAQSVAGDLELQEEPCEAVTPVGQSLMVVKDIVAVHIKPLWPLCVENAYGQVLLQIFAKQGLRQVDL